MTEGKKTNDRRTTRPALEVLDRDQDRLLYDGDERREPEIVPLSEGFPTYWDALVWYQAAGVRTLGHVEKVLPPEAMLPLSGVLDHLVDAESNESQWVRRRLVERLDGTCDLAYRQFRERANEDVESPDGERRDTDGYERNPLMRPAFKRLDETQAGALTELWSGFSDREALGRWVRGLSVPTNGEKPPQLLERIISSPVMLEALLDQESKQAGALRYRFAVGLIMPSFFAAARSLSGSERSDVQHDENISEWEKA